MKIQLQLWQWVRCIEYWTSWDCPPPALHAWVGRGNWFGETFPPKQRIFGDSSKPFECIAPPQHFALGGGQRFRPHQTHLVISGEEVGWRGNKKRWHEKRRTWDTKTRKRTWSHLARGGGGALNGSCDADDARRDQYALDVGLCFSTRTHTKAEILTRIVYPEKATRGYKSTVDWSYDFGCPPSHIPHPVPTRVLCSLRWSTRKFSAQLLQAEAFWSPTSTGRHERYIKR